MKPRTPQFESEFSVGGSDGPSAIPELDTSHLKGGRHAVFLENAAELARNNCDPDIVKSEGGIHDSHIYPGFVTLTHPTEATETFRTVIGDRNKPVPGSYAGIHDSGRVVDIMQSSNTQTSAGLVENSSSLALLDRAWMPAYLGWEDDITNRTPVGEYSTYWSSARRFVKVGEGYEERRAERNHYYVCTMTPDGEDWAVRSIIGQDAHTQDAMKLLANPYELSDQIDFQPEVFIDYGAYVLAEEGWKEKQLSSSKVPDLEVTDINDADQNTKLKRLIDRATGSGQAEVFEDYIRGMAAILKNPDMYGDVMKKKLKGNAKEMIEQYYTHIHGHRSRIGNAAHPFIRGAALLDQLNNAQEYLRLSRSGRKSLHQERLLIIQSILAAGGFLSELKAAENNDRHNAHLRETYQAQGIDVSDEYGPGVRFTALSRDDVDQGIILGVKNAMQRLNSQSAQNQYQMMSHMLGHLTATSFPDKGNARDIPEVAKDARFIIRANGNNTLEIFDSLSHQARPAQEADYHTYNGTNLDHNILGHYPFEIPSSLTNPQVNEPRYPSGLAMGGVAMRFNVGLPERGELGAPDVRCLVLSARDIPFCLEQAIHERTQGKGRNIGDLRHALDGSLRIIDILESPYTQAWHMTRYPTALHESITIDPAFHNGESFALVRDEAPGRDGRMRPSFFRHAYGRIPGQKPEVRYISKPRQPAKRGGAKLPEYRREDAAIPRGAAIAHQIGRPALLEIRAANGALYLSNTTNGANVALMAHYTPHFVQTFPAARNRKIRK